MKQKLFSKNEHFPKKFCEKSEHYINGKVKVNIIRATKKLKFLFKVNNNIKHFCSVIYQRTCSCGNTKSMKSGETKH